MDDITIDRLVLDIPGITPARAMELSRFLGQELATASSAGGNFSNITVDLAEGDNTSDTPALAKSIAASLLRQIG